MAFTLDYDDAIPLDAEALAEGGIAEGYESLLPQLRRFVTDPATIDEQRDDDAPSYSVRCGGSSFDIYAPDLDEGEGNSWGRARCVVLDRERAAATLDASSVCDQRRQ